MKPKINKKTGIILLALIIVAQLIYTTYTFAYKKENIHSDEMWSYGSANSYYKNNSFIKKGDIIQEVKDEDDCDNLNEWVPGKVLHDYVTVQKGERFAYGSVYDNLKTDLHPPLYYMAVHTVCSFFPDKFSYWYAYILNVFALIFAQIYLYKLVMLITKDHKPYIALLTCLMYAGGIGALSTFIFLRMYAWAAALATAHIYYQFRLFYSENFNIKKNIIPIAITGLLGLLTHNLYAVIMGICTACICIWLLCRKKIKKMFIYGFSMLGTLGIFFLIFPSMFSQLLNKSDSSSSIKLGFVFQFKNLLTSLTAPNLGIRFSIYDESNADIYITIAIFCLIVISIPLCFLFRKESWFINIKNKILGFFKNIFSKIKKDHFCYIKKINFPILFLLIIIIGYTAVASKIVSTTLMGSHVGRYMMPLSPLACAFMGAVVYYIISWIPYIKKIAPIACTAVICIFIARANLISENPYLFKQSDDYKDLSKLTKGKKCEVVINAPWLMTCYQADLMNCSQVKFSDYKHFYDVDNNSVTVDGIEPDETMYLIFPVDVEKKNNLNEELKKIKKEKSKTIPEKDVVKSLKENPNVKSIEKVSHVSKNGGNNCVYKIN